jgi:hypothetical protein
MTENPRPRISNVTGHLDSHEEKVGKGLSVFRVASLLFWRYGTRLTVPRYAPRGSSYKAE